MIAVLNTSPHLHEKSVYYIRNYQIIVETIVSSLKSEWFFTPCKLYYYSDIPSIDKSFPNKYLSRIQFPQLRNKIVYLLLMQLFLLQVTFLLDIAECPRCNSSTFLDEYSRMAQIDFVRKLHYWLIRYLLSKYKYYLMLT